MKSCPVTDAIISIGDALEWDVADGLHHLQTCDDCRATIDALRLTRSALRQTEPVDPVVLQRIAQSVGVSAAYERQRARAAARWTGWADVAVAGVAALLVLVSSRVPIDGAGTAILAFGMGAVLMAFGRTIARHISAFAPDGIRVYE